MDSGRTLLTDVGSFSALCELVSEGVITLDSGTRVKTINAAAHRMLGFAHESVAGVPLDELLHPSNAENPLDDAANVVFRDTLGCAVPAKTRFYEGLLVFAPATRVDEIEQLKNELVATVSHELKTPLAAIKAYTATLREHPNIYETHREEFLGVVEDQADRLARVVDDMLLITRVESDHLLRRRARVRAISVVDQALLGIAYNPAVHPIVSDLGDVELSGDPERLRDVFRNLIENAIKYSPSGGAIVIRAAQDRHATRIEIEDRGIGIEADDLPFIYDRFFRARSDASAGAAGSGLGLYIVSAIVRAHGGSIDVRSAPGKGTVFTLSLPLR
ncbi:MAG: ATP-binding protein [Candidatus Baltobacteraceae bacterium]